MTPMRSLSAEGLPFDVLAITWDGVATAAAVSAAKKNESERNARRLDSDMVFHNLYLKRIRMSGFYVGNVHSLTSR
jgi:hypothetical protein